MPTTVPGPLLLVLNHFFSCMDVNLCSPKDVELGVMTPDWTTTTTQNMFHNWKIALNGPFREAEVNDKEIQWHKKNYDCNIWCTWLEACDLVLVHQWAFKGKHKIKDRWENIPYKVLAKVNPGHLVYKVRNDGEDHVRILHHNMLLPLVAPEDSTGCDPEPVDPDGTDAGDEILM